MPQSIRFVLVFVLCAFGFAQLTSAQLSYNYIEGGLSYIDIDDVDDDFGWNINGSFRIAERVYLRAAHDRWDPIGIDVDISQIGLGFRSAINPRTDWFIDGAWIRTNVDLPGVSAENGAQGLLGVRGRPGEILEFRIFGGYVVDGPEGDNPTIGGDLTFHLTPILALSVQGQAYSGDVLIGRANLRINF